MIRGWMSTINRSPGEALRGEVMFGSEYKAQVILCLCAELQLRERLCPQSGIAELMRMAVHGESSGESAINLCRLLFRSRTGEPLRRPGLGEPGFLGNTTYSDWPL